MESFIYRLFAIKNQKQSYHPVRNMSMLNYQRVWWHEVTRVSLSVRSTVEMVCLIVISLTHKKKKVSHLSRHLNERLNSISIAPKVSSWLERHCLNSFAVLSITSRIQFLRWISSQHISISQNGTVQQNDKKKLRCFKISPLWVRKGGLQKEKKLDHYTYKQVYLKKT